MLRHFLKMMALILSALLVIRMSVGFLLDFPILSIKDLPNLINYMHLYIYIYIIYSVNPHFTPLMTVCIVIDVMGYFRAVIQTNEKSERAWQLINDAIKVNSANYIAW